MERKHPSPAGELTPPADKGTDGAPPQQIGSYRIQGEIGRGGMGVVYLARDTRLKREVVVKTLPSLTDSGDERRGMLEREAKLLALLNHPRIASIYAIEVTADGQPYLILEYVRGETLQEVLGKGPLSISDSLRIGAQIAEAIEAAHAQGVVHCDLKPANLMIATDGVKVLDFGVAQFLGNRSDAETAPSELAGEAALAGTPGYASPEQILSGKIDTAADVWAFGCVLYECLTGLKLWGEGAPLKRLRSSLDGTADLNALPRGTPDPIRNLLKRCLVKDMAHRDLSMHEVHSVLELAQSKSGLPSVGNLPRQLTSFVGRGQERVAIERISRSARLLTLTGPGGCGKTRLALELAAAQRLEHADGCWFVDLSALADPTMVPLSVASALGIALEPGSDVEELVVAHTKNRQLLIVLDNCEHLLEAASKLVSLLLAHADATKLIVTSRERLGVAGERVYAVDPLAIPDLESGLDSLELNESVQLFLERAASVAPGLEVDAGSANHLIGICRSLDGLPLALELAAARVRVLSLEQIAERLDRRFALLKTGSDSPPRHRTLRATIDWSYEQLPEPERCLLRWLSVFSASFGLERAEALCAWVQPSSGSVLDLLASLVERSLVKVERSQLSLRYRLLESIKAYGSEKLDETGELSRARDQHLALYAELGSKAATGLVGPDQVAWLDRLELEHPDLSAAVAYAGQLASSASVGLQLFADLERFWWKRGDGAEALRHFESLFAHSSSHDACVTGALLSAARVAERHSAVADATRYSELALTAAQALADNDLTIRALAMLSDALSEGGRVQEMRRYAEQAARLCNKQTPPEVRIAALSAIAVVDYRRGDYEKARLAFETVLALASGLQDVAMMANTTMNLGQMSAQLGLFDAQLRQLESAEPLLRASRDRRGLARLYLNLGVAANNAGQEDRACSRFEEALSLARELDYASAVLVALNNLGHAHFMAGRLSQARSRLLEALALANSRGSHWNTLNLLENIARLELAEGRPERAALMTGATVAERERSGVQIEATDREAHERTLSRLADELGAERLEGLMVAGGALSIDEAVARALEELS